MNTRSILTIATVATLAAIIVGCGGSDGGSTAAKSDSFSPVVGKSSDGSPSALWWRYRIGSGQPMTITEGQLTMTMTMGDLDLSIDKNAGLRRAQMSATLSGDASGTIKVDIQEALVTSDSKTLINGETWDIDMTIMGIPIAMDIVITPHSPVEWFLDRNDLDTLGQGYQHDTRSQKADVKVSVNAGALGKQNLSDTATYQDLWTVQESVASLTVAGTAYNNIVKVQRDTVMPTVGMTSGATESTTLYYWVAKGVGMIKGEGQYEIMGQKLSTELIDTNLSQ